jgi:aspartokinase/homoserine dehydrogenase 1
VHWARRPAPAARQERLRFRKPLRVLKFGGTSVGNASAILRTIGIIEDAAAGGDIVVVVSAMSGVTNQLIQAAQLSAGGDLAAVAAVIDDLRRQHATAVDALILSAKQRYNLHRKIEALLDECEKSCQELASIGRPTANGLDAVSSLGERLSAPLLAAALSDRGVASTAIEASKLIITNAHHGAAEPLMKLTSERCHLLLQPLLHQRIIPVVTGFVGGTESGALTTLGRGGSDYSATILAAALGAAEVFIWTDVDGILTADPRLVPDAVTIPELSYREAAELAYFGAKVLHPKALRPLLKSGTTVWIRNTFAPDRPGTKITLERVTEINGVTGLTAIKNVALVTVGGPGIVKAKDALRRTFAATTAARAEVLMVSQSSCQSDICFVTPSSCAEAAREALRGEFFRELEREGVNHVTIDVQVAIVAVVGQNVRGMAEIAGRTFGALLRENLSVLAVARGSSECTLSFMLASKNTEKALLAIHREFQLGAVATSIP